MALVLVTRFIFYLELELDLYVTLSTETVSTTPNISCLMSHDQKHLSGLNSVNLEAH